MDDVLKVAVAGTARAGRGLVAASAPIDRAVAQLDSQGTERRLLLTVGAYAIRRRAGVLPLTHPDVTDIAPDETSDVAPQRFALQAPEPAVKARHVPGGNTVEIIQVPPIGHGNPDHAQRPRSGRDLAQLQAQSQFVAPSPALQRDHGRSGGEPLPTHAARPAVNLRK